MTRAAFVAIVGRPSSGKSTLLNALCEQKISIVSPVPQTTRNKVRGVLTAPPGQLVFIDTPGFHHSDRKFNLHLKDLVSSALAETDFALYVLDASRPPATEEEELAKIIAEHGGRVVVAVNKIDLKRAVPDVVEQFVMGAIPTAHPFRISALAGTGVDRLKEALFEAAPEGEPMYPADIYTDQEPNFRVAEIIREKAILLTRQEVPHALFVDIADMEVHAEGTTLWIRAFIMVERESQKGIVVGKGGEKIRDIRVASQKEIARLFPYSVHLDLRVKVAANWRANDKLVRRLTGSE
ncbi:MAG TPA: GTPase Era [Spirochaetia bacterium]|nr:GTPase Era [Spirochaetia bacterium]